jgi:hypothetical protein
MNPATPADTQAIYRLLQSVSFPFLPDYPTAAALLENTHSLVLRDGGKIGLWVNVHSHEDERVWLDIATSPEYRGKLPVRKVCKEVLTYAFNMGDVVCVKCYNPRALKLALLIGFTLAPDVEDDGITLQITKAAFNG